MDSDPQGSGGLLDSSADEIGGFRVGGQISRSEAFISDPMNDQNGWQDSSLADTDPDQR